MKDLGFACRIWGLFAWRFWVCMHERLWLCLEVLGLAYMEGFRFVWRGLHACVRCFQVAQKGFGLLGGLGFAHMKDLGFDCRIWGLHA